MITGSTLRDALISGANLVAAHRRELNQLNVFPVPDGDTGANMTVTLAAARSHLIKLPDDCSVSDAAATAADVMLRASRGNSGAILTLLLRGFARSLRGLATADAKALARALCDGADMAYAAVRRPTEGTMLTVARSSGRKMRNLLLRQEATVAEGWALLCDTAREGLRRTPLQLEVLAEAGVVDAGALGLCYLLEGMGQVFAGQGIVPAPEHAETDNAFVARENNLPDVGREGVMGYKISFDMAPGGSEAALRRALAGLADDLVAVGTRSSLHARAYTTHPWETLTAVLAAGTLLQYRAEAHAAGNKLSFPTPAGSLPVNTSVTVSLPHPYCTEFTLLKDAQTEPLTACVTEFLDTLGESVVVIEGEEVLKCHVHTAHPEALFDLKLPSGYLSDLKIENMAAQMARK